MIERLDDVDDNGVAGTFTQMAWELAGLGDLVRNAAPGQWSTQLAGLREEFPVAVVDLPGHGEYSAMPWSPGAATEALRAAEQKAAEREAGRPACADCGAKFTDQRWDAVHRTDWGAPQDTHPKLCGDCKQRARQEQAHRERQEQEQVLPEQKASGWLSRLRP
ncbi:hypothetical protein [Streptomyces lunaelactis]|uniref:hypothetical protein n=1 Tax=Streptomyces lunaelactis TaxID=1535768 RepID=UPI0035A13E64